MKWTCNLSNDLTETNKISFFVNRFLPPPRQNLLIYSYLNDFLSFTSLRIFHSLPLSGDLTEHLITSIFNSNLRCTSLSFFHRFFFGMGTRDILEIT